METEFIPKDPETLNDFDEVLAEYNRVNETELNFTDSYTVDTDLYVSEETTADGYGIWTMRTHGQDLNLENDVFYYEPGVDTLFRAINDNSYGGPYTVYIEIRWEEVQEYMFEELVTNHDNYLQEIEDNKE